MEDTSLAPGTPAPHIYTALDVFQSRHASRLWAWASPPILILGTIGNILSAVVMNRKTLRKSTTSLYLTVLAAFDLLALYFGLLTTWMDKAFTVDIPCDLMQAVLYFALHMDAWCLVSVSLERFTAVWFPSKHSVIFTRKRAVIGLIAISVLILSETSHFLYTNRNCVVPDKYMYLDFVVSIYPMIDLFIGSLIPFSIMIITSVAIIGKLVINSRKLNQKKPSSMTTTLLVVTFSFLLFTFPICIFLVIIPAAVEDEAFDMYVTMYAVVSLLAYLNFAINFVLYCLMGRKFREELKAMLGMKNKVGPVSSSAKTAGTE